MKIGKSETMERIKLPNQKIIRTIGEWVITNTLVYWK